MGRQQLVKLSDLQEAHDQIAAVRSLLRLKTKLTYRIWMFIQARCQLSARTDSMPVSSWHDRDPGTEVRNHDHQLMFSNSAEHRQHSLFHAGRMQRAAAVLVAVLHGLSMAALVCQCTTCHMVQQLWADMVLLSDADVSEDVMAQIQSLMV